MLDVPGLLTDLEGTGPNHPFKIANVILCEGCKHTFTLLAQLIFDPGSLDANTVSIMKITAAWIPENGILNFVTAASVPGLMLASERSVEQHLHELNSSTGLVSSISLYWMSGPGMLYQPCAVARISLRLPSSAEAPENREFVRELIAGSISQLIAEIDNIRSTMGLMCADIRAHTN